MCLLLHRAPPDQSDGSANNADDITNGEEFKNKSFRSLSRAGSVRRLSFTFPPGAEMKDGLDSMIK